MLTGHGLAVALEQVAARAPVPVRLTVKIEGRLPEQVEIAAYYVVTESLANIAKHAQATAARVGVSRTDGRRRWSRSSTTVSAAPTASEDRACAVSPTASRRSAAGFASGRPRGGGTRVRAEIPCA